VQSVPAVLLATCAAHPDGDEDGPQLLGALRQQGIDAQWRAWDDPTAPWQDAPTVLRATWDYTLRRGEFLRWAASVPHLLNPYEVVVWNSDKVYLDDLAAAGLPVTPTVIARPGDPVHWPGDGEIVVKPSVGAGSRGAGRFGAEDPAARSHAQVLHDAGRTVLVQPYLHGVDEHGETALVYLDGAFSHAIGKAALLTAGAAHGVHDKALYVEEDITARTATAAERAIGDAVLAHLAGRFGTLLYVRVDLLPAADGPVLVEVEAVEPSLFLSFAPGALDRFAAAIAQRLS
jgi:glutathione synthase/RimK-type ligase-like ATP-grasp enzyme